MYYVIKEYSQSKYSIMEIEHTTDATFHIVKQSVFECKGQWGREDYATLWCNFYNGEITRDEMEAKFDVIQDMEMKALAKINK